MTKPIIEVKELSFTFNEEAVLKGVTFTIYEGELVTFFGPNGGGKTTLLHLLMGFYTTNKGSLSILGQSCQKARDKMGFVPQHFNYDKEFPISILEVVLGGFTLPWHGKASYQERKKAHQMLEMLGLGKLIHRSFSEASGGQQQRVLLARALVSDPAILFLDEPTSSIDVEAKKIIYDLLASLKGKITIILVSHDLQNVLQLADRFFCVQTTLTSMAKEKICSHVPLGLYHGKESN